ncbi:type IV secretory system conjugative DNA transfer family protein [Frankia sp. AgKG'84/4]|uniref:type IV secretory system conjugative DNA transfer family protein n=1 Tax=Frankia sp. AgKG'84/4 TaxID=573490 RepID=UPI00200D14AD|nr:type IV secretory system conjugative DNA transfer family protein [Frankia sp. AgKG'84/4]MCL9795240.1 type IV secretory system conjugative DNA transfer family protein [Frankia sp. AgKG'84/4]
MNEPQADVPDNSVDVAVAVLIFFLGSSVYLISVLFWLAEQLSSFFVGNGWPQPTPAGPVSIVESLVSRLESNPGPPPSESHRDAGPPWLTYVILTVLLLSLLCVAIWLARFALNWRRRREYRLFRLGFASGQEIRKVLGAQAVLRKGPSVRPSRKVEKNVEPREVGFYLGRDIRSRQELFASVEDVFIILAPPRQGKDVHFCTPFTIDAPGPCMVTSTRADAFSNTYGSRARMGEIHVFDPNGLTSWPERLRWSPVRGCDDPFTAATRASSFVAGAGFEVAGDGALYRSAAITVLRCYLHAASLGGRTIADIIRWSTEPTDPEPIKLLQGNALSSPSAEKWAGELESMTGADPKFRSATWANLVQALSCFSDPAVVDACSPGQDEIFDLKKFVSGKNTLYVLGKDKKHGSIAPIVTAMLEDIFDETRKIASRMPGSRLDPPLTIELNEAAHIAPLPNLPSYMGDSGGFSIALHVYLQSLSQARARWGEHEAMIMWDNAAVRIIMGGAGNVDDLEDISRLMGETPTPRPTTAGPRSRRVLSPEEIRTLEFGTAVVVARSARPVEVKLTPWWKRPDGKDIASGKGRTEEMILSYSK